MNQIKWTLIIGIAIISVLGYFTKAEGAEITLESIQYVNNDNVTITQYYIHYNGMTADGDTDKLQTVINEAIIALDAPNTEFSTLVLEGPGGYQYEMLGIIDLVKQYSISTEVFGECYSACAAIWASGENRYFDSDATVGFHWGYTDTDVLDEIKDDYGWQGLRDWLIIGLLRDESSFLEMNPHIDPIKYLMGISNSNPGIFWEITTSEAREIFGAIIH